MGRMKTFLKYLIIFIAFYLISNLVIEYCLKANYETLASNNIETVNYDVNIQEAKSTNANGQISGEVSKKENASEENKYLKIDFYNQRDQLMGTKYIDISSLKDGEKKKFNVDFKLQGVARYVITEVNQIEGTDGRTINTTYLGIGILVALILIQSAL